MNKLHLNRIYATIILVFCTSHSSAESIASFPKDLKSWFLVKESIIPGKDVILPDDTPLFLQEDS